jgi:hypothetical protein
MAWPENVTAHKFWLDYLRRPTKSVAFFESRIFCPMMLMAAQMVGDSND